ncbi:hypothetical protein TNCV_3318311 [Trichonephila clavipes]|nr:hypothetical protein TNCV_3318311 [Trichonephila clavipes]
MDSYQHEMGRPPPSAKNAKTQTPHNTSKRQNDPPKNNLHDNSKSNSNRNKEREKNTTNQAHLRSPML